MNSDAGRRHIWLWLTKRPGRMAEFSKALLSKGISWPQNLWVGTSITSNVSLSRIDDIAKVGTAETKKFLSVEPQLEEISWNAVDLSSISWIIQGGESGGMRRSFDLNWARELRDICRAGGTPYFLKQLGDNPVENGKSVKIKGQGSGGDWDFWPEDLRIREMPFERETSIFDLLGMD